MTPNDFWCRAFLAAMGGHYTPTDEGKVVAHGPAAAWCEQAADAALAVAQRRGMVAGEAEVPAPAAAPEPDVLRWLAAQESHRKVGPRFGVWRPSRGAYQERRFYAQRVDWTSVGLCLVGEEDGRELAFAAFHIMRDWTRVDAPVEAPAPKLERPVAQPVEFWSERRGDTWVLRGGELGAMGIQVLSGHEAYPMGNGVVRIKWDTATTPPSPVEVTIERAPKLERVEFTAARQSGGGYVLTAKAFPDGLLVALGDDVVNLDEGTAIRIKWGSTPPHPIEVWIERRG